MSYFNSFSKYCSHMSCLASRMIWPLSLFSSESPAGTVGQGVILWYTLPCIAVNSLPPSFARHLTTLLLPPQKKPEDEQSNLGSSYKEVDTSALCPPMEHSANSFRECVLVSHRCHKPFCPLHGTMARHYSSPKNQG